MTSVFAMIALVFTMNTKLEDMNTLQLILVLVVPCLLVYCVYCLIRIFQLEGRIDEEEDYDE